jgi:hypothetical protein
MKTNNIKKGYRKYTPVKGRNYAIKQQCHLFVTMLAVVALVLILQSFADSSFICAGGAGLSLASMAVIGHIGDVGDSETHGSDISYFVYLISADQIDKTKAFPQPNGNREVAPIPMLDGEIPHYFEAHDIPTFSASTEKGDITTTGENSFVIIMGGARVVLYNFIEQYSGGKFIIVYKHIKDSQWNILGELERPMILNNTESKDDKDGRYTTFTFKRSSVSLPCLYLGNPQVTAATQVAADATDIAISAASNTYKLQNGTAASVAVKTVSGLTNTDKGRYITVVGTGTDKAATIADGSTFILVDGATFTAKNGSSITFRVVDSNTLVEITRTEVG